METRKSRALKIVEAGGVRQDGQVWRVPSQSTFGTYEVAIPRDGRRPTCTCPDYEAGSAFCKHIFAVEIFEGRLNVEPNRPRFEDNRDWTAVNAAHCHEKEHVLRLAHELCSGIQEAPQEKGRPRVPRRDIVLGALLWVHGTRSCRYTTYDFEMCKEKGLLSRRLDFRSMMRHLQDPSLTPLLRTLLRESALPFRYIEQDFAIDATGFSTSMFHRWRDFKWGKDRRERLWLKAHAVCGVTTHIVTDCKVIDAGDSTQFEELVKNTAVHFHVAQISADGAYASYRNTEVAEEVGAVPFIPVQDRVTGDTGPEVWRRMVGYFRYREAEFRKHYHKRSNVETLFSQVKRVFGGAVRGKKRVVQENEILLKFICHNLRMCIMAMYELGDDISLVREVG